MKHFHYKFSWGNLKKKATSKSQGPKHFLILILNTEYTGKKPNILFLSG